MKLKENRKQKEFIIVGIFLALVFIILLVLSQINSMLLWDETVYLGNSRSHITQSNFTEDFRFPLLEWIISFAWLFTGESILVAKLIVILFAIASLFMLYVISRKYFSFKISSLLLFLFALTPLFLFWGFRVYTDFLGVFFMLLSFYFLLKDKNKYYALAGVFSALAFLARFPFALFPFSAGLYLLFKKRFKPLLFFVLFFIIALIPWMTYNMINYGNPVWDFMEQYKGVSQWTSPQPPLNQLYNLFIYANLFIPFLLIKGFYFIIKKKQDKNLNYLSLFYISLSFVYYLFFVNLKDPRYYLPFLPFIYLVSFQGLTSLKKIKKNFFKIAIILLISAFVINAIFFVSYMTVNNYCDKNSSIAQSVSYLKDKTATNDILLGNAWPWYGYHLNTKVFSLYDENIPALIQEHEPKYILYTDNIGIEFDKKILDESPLLVLEEEFVGNCDNTYVYRVK